MYAYRRVRSNSPSPSPPPPVIASTKVYRRPRRILFLIGLAAWLTAIIALLTLHDPTQISSILPPRLPVPHLPVRQSTLRAVRKVHDSLPDDTDLGGRHMSTRAALERFAGCLEKWKGCMGEKTERVVIMAGFWITGPFYGCTSGECIWADSISYALHELGYTVLYADNMDELLKFYRATKDFTSLIIMQKELIDDCLNKPNMHCFKSAEHPDALPLWKTVMFWFWPGGRQSMFHEPELRWEFRHPLGGQWVISPEDYKKIPGMEWSNKRYIGYSIEHHCPQQDYVPFEQRPNRVYVFGKIYDFFTNDWAYSYPSDKWFAQTKAHYTSPSTPATPFSPPGPALRPDFEFIAGVKDTNLTWVLDGVENLGKMGKEAFRKKISASRAVMGLGWPEMSPTPYVAMCMGVPFINPIVEWDKDDPMNRTKWTRSQHSTFILFPEPHAYHFFKRDGESAFKALEKALNTPTPPYIPPEMKMEAFKARMVKLVDNDWYAEAKERVKEKSLTDFVF